MNIEIIRYKMISKGSILALVTIKVPGWGNLLINGITLFHKPPNKWISFPARKDEQGKYWEYIAFEAHQDKKDFGHDVFKAFEAKVAEERKTQQPPQSYQPPDLDDEIPDFL